MSQGQELRRFHAGFTLIELLTVMAIIGLLVGASVGVAKYTRQKALIGRAKADMGQISHVITEHLVENGVVPGDLTVIEKDLPENVDTIDPWENPYVYATNGPRTFALYSKGPNTSINADDISALE